MGVRGRMRNNAVWCFCKENVDYAGTQSGCDKVGIFVQTKMMNG